jgi:hypothetical protein
VPRALAHPGRPHVPAALPYLSRRRAREGAPNPSRTRGTAPDLPHRPPEEKVEEEKEGGRGAVRGRAVRREDWSRPWEELDPP